MMECVAAILAFMLLVAVVAYLIYREHYAEPKQEWVPIKDCPVYYRISADTWNHLKKRIGERNAEVNRLRHIVEMYATGCEQYPVEPEEKQ